MCFYISRDASAEYISMCWHVLLVRALSVLRVCSECFLSVVCSECSQSLLWLFSKCNQSVLRVLELKMSDLPKRAQQLWLRASPYLLLILHDKLSSETPLVMWQLKLTGGRLRGGGAHSADEFLIWRILIVMATYFSKPNLGIFPGEAIKIL